MGVVEASRSPAERRVPRFFYIRGVLEISSPSAEHEEIAGLIASLVRELAVEWGTDMRAAGHATFRREDPDRGFEPDGGFYFLQNAKDVRGKTDLDLDAGDPPPDLVVEVDRASRSLDKLPVYSRLGVPEVWRYIVGAGRPEVLALESQARDQPRYEPIFESRVLPPLTAEALARFVELVGRRSPRSGRARCAGGRGASGARRHLPEAESRWETTRLGRLAGRGPPRRSRSFSRLPLSAMRRTSFGEVYES